MADNITINPGTGGPLVATDEVAYSGDTASVQLVRVVTVSGAEGSKTVGGVDPLVTIAGAVQTEDAVHSGGASGIMALAVRQDADGPMAADGDYTPLQTNAVGRLKASVEPAMYPLVTGNITASAQTVFAQVDRSSNVMVFMVATSLTGHNVTFEGSLNSTNGTDGSWFAIQAVRSNANTIETTSGVLTTTPVYAWELSVNGLAYFRVRATAHTGGTAAYQIMRGAYATEPIPAAQISGTQPVSGTVTATLSAPPAPATPYFLNSAASTNVALILTGTSSVHSFYATNTGATAAFVKLYNKATAPALASDIPEMIIPVPAAVSGVPGVAQLNGGFIPHRFALGLGIAVTGGVADADATAVAAGQVRVKLARTT